MKNSLGYAFYFTATAIAHVFWLFIFFMKPEGACACVLLCFSNFISFGPVIGLLLYLYGFIFSVSRSNVTNVWLTICRFFSFTQMNKRIFLLRRLVWPSFFITDNFMNYVFCFVKKIELASWIHLFQRRFIIFHFFSVSKVINKIFRFRRYICCTFSFFINKNAKMKT